MALFKIEKGLKANLANNRPNTTEGFCYFTTDDGKFYIDTATAIGTSNRVLLNAGAADKLTVNAGAANKPIYFKDGVPAEGSYELNKTVPSNAVFTDTNTKVTQTVTTSNAAYPLLLAPNGQTATTTTTSYFDSGVTLNPSTNTITATTFAGNLSGNATSATQASYVLDYNNNTPTYFGYSTTGMQSADWLGAWDATVSGQYRLRAIQPSKLSVGYASNSNKADKLTVNAGAANKPIYFKDGVPTEGSYELNKTVPSDAKFTDTNTKVTQTVTASNAAYPLLLAPSGQTATTTTTSYFDSGVTLNPNTNTIAANISGNAATATTAASCSGNAASASSVAWGNVSGKPSSYTPSSHDHDDRYKKQWHAVIQGSTWSRICHVACHTSIEGSNGILSVKWTRGSVVANAVFAIVSQHANGYSRISQLISGPYTQFQIRTVNDYSGNLYIEIYDNANSIATTTQQIISCSWIPICAGALTPYTSFQSGASIPSGWSVGDSYSTSCGMKSSQVHGAVWNDYAEYRICNEDFKPGQVVLENGDDTLSIANQRLQRGCSIISDTFGFAIGETDKAKCPIAVSGRVLAYCYESREEFKKHIGWPVCSGPNGTVSIMTEEEEEKYPSRIIGTVSAVPDYETWGTGNVEVNNRIWIKIK